MAHALIIGASRGIGAEFVRQYRAEGWQVTATARGDEALAALRAQGATAIALDVTSAESVSRLAWQLEGVSFDVIVNVAGVLKRQSGLEAPSDADFDHTMHANVLAPMRVLPQLVDKLAPGAKLALISSKMGSMGARNATSSWLYRASKAAANSVLKDISLEWAGKAVCVSFHPGWVRTDMGGAGADIGVEDSVAGMRRVIAGLAAQDNGRFLNYDGSEIPW
ncbi:MAG: SDR family oxidoreductase [Piscinibacter sp.]|uniref:SDR family oxidoreductase n=1 Tax=Piscinibacter sp. TaxID=1903157 RepID=UPI001B7AC1DF|nr:SDR family oxidoreductase [Piscinibacter sp.]MBP5989729.1 SDR family oxidoreductase [Piscinibacter sp.]MBP6027845.1 SDR family oxidoreductase [Piscinibacter sp.]